MASPPFDVEGFIAAWNDHDAERVLAYYADDVEVRRPTLPEPLRGKAAMRTRVDEFLEAFPDVRFEVEEEVQDVPEAAALVRISGTHRGTLRMLGGRALPPTGLPISYEIAVFLKLDESGRIARDTGVFDVAEFQNQLFGPHLPRGGAELTAH